jgi:excisionase family DNA binding protein
MDGHTSTDEIFDLGRRPEILTLPQAAEYLQVSLATLKRTIREDPKFPVFPVGGERSRTVRVSRAALDAWVAQQKRRRRSVARQAGPNSPTVQVEELTSPSAP